MYVPKVTQPASGRIPAQCSFCIQALLLGTGFSPGGFVLSLTHRGGELAMNLAAGGRQGARFTWKAWVRRTQATEPVPPPPPQKCGRQPALSLPRNPLPAASAKFFILSRSCSTDHIPILRVAVHGSCGAPGDAPATIPTLAVPPNPSTEWLSQQAGARRD